MENVAFDLPQYYPPIPLPPYATGEVKNIYFFYQKLQTYSCDGYYYRV